MMFLNDRWYSRFLSLKCKTKLNLCCRGRWVLTMLFSTIQTTFFRAEVWINKADSEVLGGDGKFQPARFWSSNPFVY